jgi:hypothetical protein
MHPLTVSPLLLIVMFVEMLKASLPELEQVASSWHQMLHPNQMEKQLSGLVLIR